MPREKPYDHATAVQELIRKLNRRPHQMTEGEIFRTMPGLAKGTRVLKAELDGPGVLEVEIPSRHGSTKESVLIGLDAHVVEPSESGSSFLIKGKIKRRNVKTREIIEVTGVIVKFSPGE